MDYSKVLRLPQYFRNLHRLSEIVRVLIKHGFGDLVSRLQLTNYLQTKIEIFSPASRAEMQHLDLAARLRLVFEELGPTFIKFAQLISTRPDIFPQTVTDEFKKLQDDVPPFPFELAKERIESELGRPLAEIFERFDEIPLGAASIAQVHRAKLRSGHEVVVKIQRPNVDRIIETDTEILLGLATLIEEHIPESVQFNPFNLVEEFSRSLKLERDFEREAQSMERFSRRFSYLPLLVIPRVYEEFSTKKVLTQSFVEGRRGDEKDDQYFDKRTRKEIVETLNEVVLRSIFEDGFFHADPHPGNLLFTGDGRVALIDFGAMGRLERARSAEVLRFLLAILNRDLDRLLKVLYENQVVPPSLDELKLKNQVSELLDTYLGRSLGRLNLSALLGDVFEVVRHHGIKPPADLLLVAKSITSLQHIGAALDPDFDPVRSIKPYLVRQYVERLTNPYTYLNLGADLIDSYGKLLADLPVELRALIKHLARDKFSLSIRHEQFGDHKIHQSKMLNRAIMAAMGIVVLWSGVTLLTIPSVNQTVSSIVIAWGVLILVVTWFSVRRSGGI